MGLQGLMQVGSVLCVGERGECGGKSLREHPANGREDCSGALSVGECTIQ